MPSGRTNNLPWKWAWPTSRDPTICGIRSNISQKLLELETSNLMHAFVYMGNAEQAHTKINNFHESGIGLGHVTSTILVVRSAILATAWLLVLFQVYLYTYTYMHILTGYCIHSFTVNISQRLFVVCGRRYSGVRQELRYLNESCHAACFCLYTYVSK